MGLNDAKARSFGSNTVAIKDESGYWKVITNMVERISFDGENFEEEKLEAMGIDKDFQAAFDTALMSVLNAYQEKTGGRGTMFTKLLENDNTKTNEDSKT